MRAAALLPWQNSARAFGTAMRCRHRWLSFAAYITWVCCTATAMELMWRSGGGSDESLIGINGLSARVGSTHAVHARRSHHLATYLLLHVPTHFPELGSRVSAGFFASTAGVVGQRAQVALWSMGVHLPLGAHGAFAAVLGMAAGSAVRVRASRSRVLLVCLCASLVPHCG